MAEKDKQFSDEELDKKLDDLDKQLNSDRLRKLLKAKILQKINTGEVELLPYLDRLEIAEMKLGEIPGKDKPEGDDYGIPENLRIKRRPYTMTPEAIDQRRKAANSPKHAEAMKGNNNAWKHGQYAETFLKQVFSPCLSTCEDYPCSLVSDGKTAPGDFCLDKIELAESLRAMSKAIQNGDLSEFKELAAVRLGGLDAVLKMLIEDVTNENTVVKSELFGKDGQHLGYKIVPHPSLNYIAELAKTLGYSFEQFLATPLILKKTESEAKAAESLATMMGRAAEKVRKAQEGKKKK